MDRVAKEQLVASLHETFTETAVVVVTQYSGLSVGEMTDLRAQMREAGANVKVTKNRLTKRALSGTRYAGLDEMFVGPTAMAYSSDPVAAAKVTVGFAKTHPKLIVIGGSLGEKVLDAEGVKALAALPSLDELRAKLVGLVATPATRLAVVLQAPAGQIARVLSAYAEQGQGEAGEQPAA
ncbi:MAG: 50S ribosomal protein L10 [Rhodospirillales bacterium]|nr:50S ribosomal protein L10 [Rhodospirillales bacterium]